MNRNAAAFAIASLTTLGAAISLDAIAQERHDPAALIAAQREAMGVFKSMDGVWRGPAWSITPAGDKREFVQTERIGPFLDGSVKVMEGRGNAPDGKVTFNAFGIVSYDVAKKAFSMHSYAQGMVGDFAFVPTGDGYAWQIPAGPGVTIKYVATIKDGTLTEVGDRVVAGKDPQRIFEMHLKRVGDTDWPAAGAIGLR